MGCPVDRESVYMGPGAEAFGEEKVPRELVIKNW